MKERSSEINYMTTMSVVKSLLNQGILDEEDYKQINTIFTEKYTPSLGSLLFDNALNIR